MRPRPGDVFGSTALGVQGVIIRHGTGSNVGHCGIVSHLLEDGPDPLWRTIEALGGRGSRGVSGVQWATRRQSTMVELHSPLSATRDVAEGIVVSDAQTESSAGYDFAEVVRLGLYVLARGLEKWKLRPLAWLLDKLGEAIHRHDDPQRLFCSQAVWTTLLTVRPELAVLSSQPADRIWPGELMRALRVLDRERQESCAGSHSSYEVQPQLSQTHH